jgi:hypothetical protein
MRVLGRFGAPSGNDLLLRWREVEVDCPAIAMTWTMWWPMAIWPGSSPSMRMSAVSSLKVAFHIRAPSTGRVQRGRERDTISMPASTRVTCWSARAFDLR